MNIILKQFHNLFFVDALNLCQFLLLFVFFVFFNQQQAKTNLFAQSCYNNNRMATSMKLGNIYGLMTEFNFIFVREQLQVAALFNWSLRGWGYKTLNFWATTFDCKSTAQTWSGSDLDVCSITCTFSTDSGYIYNLATLCNSANFYNLPFRKLANSSLGLLIN